MIIVVDTADEGLVAQRERLAIHNRLDPDISSVFRYYVVYDSTCDLSSIVEASE